MARVLVVDDNLDITHLIALQLRAAGHDVSTAANGREALDVVERSGPPDVAVLDLVMPGMDGFTLAGLLRQRPGCARVPLVFLTASSQLDDITTGLALGGIYLTKPWPQPSLLAAIERPRAAAFA